MGGLSLSSFDPIKNLKSLGSDPFSEGGIKSSLLLGGPDPGVAAGIKLHESIFNDPLAPPTSEPGDLTAAFRRPIQERMVTDLFAGVAGPTQAITDMRRKKLKSQRGIAASSGSISAAARTLLVGSTGKSSEELAAEAAVEKSKLKVAAETKAQADFFAADTGGN